MTDFLILLLSLSLSGSFLVILLSVSRPVLGKPCSGVIGRSIRRATMAQI